MPTARGLDRRTTMLMAFVCASSVANLYYLQPLLAELAKYFQASERSLGIAATLSQVGYGLGVLLIVPLGDILERKKLILTLLTMTAVVLAAIAGTSTIGALIALQLVLGFITAAPQIVMPYAASLATPEQRPRAVGLIQSGLLIGILCARSVSGVSAELFGWRMTYVFAASLSLVTALVVYGALPSSRPTHRSSYFKLIRSIFEITRAEPRLQKIIVPSTIIFGTFGVFWTTLSFRLVEPPYHFGPAIAGFFGLIGVVGALIAPYASRLCRTRGFAFVQYASLATIGASFALFALTAYHLAFLIVGVIVLDAGIQGNHMANQIEVFELSEHARSRMNGMYMFTRFAGGAAGSLAGTYVWSVWGWAGVCGLGAALSLAAVIVYRQMSTPQTESPRSSA